MCLSDSRLPKDEKRGRALLPQRSALLCMCNEHNREIYFTTLLVVLLPSV